MASAPRAAWKGFLRVGAVSCGVKVVGVVTEADKIHFNVLNRKTGNRVRAVYVDEETNEEVPSEEQIKGWEADKGDFIEVESEEIKALKLTSEHTLDIDDFVPLADIDTRYLEKPYYLIPADKPSMEAFAVLRDALANKKMAARSCVVMYQHGHDVVIQPYGEGMLMPWLRPHNQVVSESSVFDDLPTGKQDKDGDRRATDRQEAHHVRHLRFRGPLRRGAHRTHRCQTQGQEGAEEGTRGAQGERRQSCRGAAQEPRKGRHPGKGQGKDQGHGQEQGQEQGGLAAPGGVALSAVVRW